MKDEQRDRIKTRDGLIYSVIVAVAAVAGATRLAGTGAVALLLPPVVLALGWVYLINDEKISAIGRYVRTDLAPRLTALAGAEVLRWETAHRTDARRRERKLVQLAVDLIVFALPAAAAIAWYWSAGPVRPALLVVSVAEALAVLVAAWQIIAYADLSS